MPTNIILSFITIKIIKIVNYFWLVTMLKRAFLFVSSSWLFEISEHSLPIFFIFFFFVYFFFFFLNWLKMFLNLFFFFYQFIQLSQIWICDAQWKVRQDAEIKILVPSLGHEFWRNLLLLRFVYANNKFRYKLLLWFNNRIK